MSEHRVATLGEAIQSAGKFGESADSSQLQYCGKRQGLKRRGSFSDVGGINMSSAAVKVEEDHHAHHLHHQLHSSESRHKMGDRNIQKGRRLAVHQELRINGQVPATPDVSCTQEDHHVEYNDVGVACDHRELAMHRRREELLVRHGERDAEMWSEHVRSVEVELQGELWRTTEEVNVARKQRDDAIAGNQVQMEQQCDQVYEVEMRLKMELQKARQELAILHQERDDALRKLESQSKHQEEQVAQIEREIHGELQKTLNEIAVVRKQRDDAVAEKHIQLEQQCDVVFEIEMGLQMELRRVVGDLESAQKEHAAAVMEVHLQQEHQHEQVLQIEMELQGQIQMKSEELKVVQKERDKALSETHSLLELQCDQVTQVEMQLQRDLQQVLDDLHSAHEKLPSKKNATIPSHLEHHLLDQVREIQETLLLSREKLNCLKKQCNVIVPDGDDQGAKFKLTVPVESSRRGGNIIRDQKQNLSAKTKSLQTPQDLPLKVS